MATAGGRIIQTKLLLLQINSISFFVGIQTLNFAFFSSFASICLYFGNIAFTLLDSQLEFQILWNSVRVSTSNCTAEQLCWVALDMFHVQLLKCSQFTLSLIFRQNKWALVSKCGYWSSLNITLSQGKNPHRPYRNQLSSPVSHGVLLFRDFRLLIHIGHNQLTAHLLLPLQASFQPTSTPSFPSYVICGIFDLSVISVVI